MMDQLLYDYPAINRAFRPRSIASNNGCNRLHQSEAVSSGGSGLHCWAHWSRCETRCTIDPPSAGAAHIVTRFRPTYKQYGTVSITAHRRWIYSPALLLSHQEKLDQRSVCRERELGVCLFFCCQIQITDQMDG